MTPNMNLLPRSTRMRQTLLAIVMRWGGIMAIVVSLTCLWGLQDVLRSKESQGTMRQLQDLAEPIRLQQLESRRLRQTYVQLQDQESLESQLAEQRSLTDLMGIVVRASKASHGNVGIRIFELSQRLRDDDTANYVLSIEGVATDDLSVARFAAALRDSAAFTRVQLSSTSPVTEAGVTARSFSLECSY